MEYLAASISVDQIFQFDKFVVPIENENTVFNLLIFDIAVVIHDGDVMQEMHAKKRRLRDILYEYFKNKNPYYFLDTSQRDVIHHKLIKIINGCLTSGNVIDVLFTISQTG